MNKLREDTTWKDAQPAFTCDLWHSRCMKEYFTMTAHWIHIGGSPLAPTWELWHRMLGLYSVEDSPIDHQRCAYSLHASVTCQICPLLTMFPNCCIVVYLQSLLGLPWSNVVCSNCTWTSLLLSPIAGATSPRLSTPPFNGIGFIVDAIYTQFGEHGARELEELCR